MTLNVGTYNIRHGQDVGLDYSVIAADIADLGLDLCGIQEVDEYTERNGNRDTLGELSDGTGLSYTAFAKTIDLQGGAYGTGILSRYPIMLFETVLLPSGSYEQRAFGHARIDIGGCALDFFNTHLTFCADEEAGREYRTRQMAALADAVAGKTRWIVTGDFNTEDFSLFDLFENAQLVNNERMKMITNAEDGAIDNIVCPARAAILERGRYDKVRHSDHDMIWAKIQFDGIG